MRLHRKLTGCLVVVFSGALYVFLCLFRHIHCLTYAFIRPGAGIHW